MSCCDPSRTGASVVSIMCKKYGAQPPLDVCRSRNLEIRLRGRFVFTIKTIHERWVCILPTNSDLKSRTEGRCRIVYGYYNIPYL